MIYPEFLRAGTTIGVTAPSDGVTNELKKKRFKNAVRQLSKRDINVVITDNVFASDERGCSGSAKLRGEQFNNLIEDRQVKAIISAAGGNYLSEMLEYVNYNGLKDNPKWVQGYSDNTGLLYSITTNYDIATIYGCNFGEFGMERWETSVDNAFDILCGRKDIQKSFDYYENDFHDYETGLEGYYKDAPVNWKNARGEDKITVSGRLIGGCLDVLMLICGTRFDGTEKFIEKYKNDGILWYLESFDIKSEEMANYMWKLKEMGYFKYASGFVFGRPMFTGSWSDITYEQSVMYVLDELKVPVIFDADIGHKGPQFSIINGAVGMFESKKGKGKLTMRFK
ncbi:MAG: S66 peptidase family protein [Eubacterium sp.]